MILPVLARLDLGPLFTDDRAFVAAALGVTTLLLVDLSLTRWASADPIPAGRSVVLVDDGTLILSALRDQHVDEDDILEAAWLAYGIDRLEQIGRATLDPRGRIAITPRSSLP